MTGRAIWAAYADTGAINVPCPHCGATPNTWCSRDDGRVRRVPCVDRIAISGAVNATDSRNFTEPTHPSGVTQ